MRTIAAVALAVVYLAPPALAGTETISNKPMGFNDCKWSIKKVSRSVGKEPVVVTDTALMYLVKYYTADGEVMVACSKPDGCRLITVSK